MLPCNIIAIESENIFDIYKRRRNWMFWLRHIVIDNPEKNEVFQLITVEIQRKDWWRSEALLIFKASRSLQAEVAAIR